MAGEDDFTIQVGDFVAGARERARVAFLAIGLESLSRVRELTPVRTGLLRASWQIQRAGDQRPAVRGPMPKTAREAENYLAKLKEEQGLADAALQQVYDAQLGEKLVIVNPVVYARAVEYGREIERKDGSTSTTPARGMAAQTVAEIPALAKAVVQAITGRSQ
jgi:hypothetical protein